MMAVIRKKNPKTGEWEVYGSTDAKDIINGLEEIIIRE